MWHITSSYEKEKYFASEYGDTYRNQNNCSSKPLEKKFVIMSIRNQVDS